MALHYATAKSRQQALLKWIRQSPRIPQCKRFLKMFLPPSSGSVILSLARLRTLDRAFSSGGERFPDTEEVRSSNLLTPTKCSQLRGYVLWAVLFLPPIVPANMPATFMSALLRVAPQESFEMILDFSLYLSRPLFRSMGWAGMVRDDRNMLVKHNLLDSFGVSGLVLVGFVSGLTKGVL